MSRITLENRGIVHIHGPDAETLLQDVITCDLLSLEPGVARQGALLTPQGKIMFDFLVSRYGEDGFRFDIDRVALGDFVKRMTMYKLRAKVFIEHKDSESVTAVWNEETPQNSLADERFAQDSGVYRLYGEAGGETASLLDYDNLRIDYGVAEAGRDYETGDAFPHDALMDLNRGVSFKKGCFVGQEVVSRMQHRGTARRRVMRVLADADLPETGSAITIGDKPVGTLGSVAGARALAIVRTDRVASALGEDAALLAGDVPVRLVFPGWTGLMLAQGEQESGSATQ
ncbi:folate-binding protein YgfZ [Hoeflea sp. WL0058]|uniref:Folate-binding protein YgfZ n=1 Tax=Flavimaribacter sediminis TaxID=2865987 RepID=A0AAE2ZNU5_9HYPH|nr:folate-binding protein YgfZ [Flavimaribacter sediminis]MBW8639581.1 folate-binding protein YgfZ [Flavimaribacter sediminis]